MTADAPTCVVFVSAHNAKNILNWSGTLTSLYESLKNQDPTIAIYAIDGSWLTTLAKQCNRVLFWLGYRFDCQLTTAFAFAVGLYTTLRIAFLPSGPLVLAAASNYAPFLFTRRQVVYISDGPFRAAAKIYPELKTLPRWLYSQYDNHEAMALKKADFIILPSKWAVDSAELDYDVPSKKIHRLPFGANIPPELIEKFIVPKQIPEDRVNFLFTSADWSRKGGDKAVAICQELVHLGIPAHLTIVGRAPDNVNQLGFVTAKGFLRKSHPEELIEICKTYRESHFFLLPTTADASPIVFAEAQAFGVPPISHDVGGTSSSIEHKKTGLLFDLNAPPKQIALEIMYYVKNPNLYGDLSLSCRKWYLANAQWSNWSDLIFRLCGLKRTSVKDQP